MKTLYPFLFLLITGVNAETDEYLSTEGVSGRLVDKSELPHYEQKEKWIVLEARDAGRKGTWDLDRSNCSELARKARSFLREARKSPDISTEEKKEMDSILSKWGRYSCQFIPYTEDGESLVQLNFFPFGVTTSYDVEEKYVLVSDGGSDFWKITYKVKEDTFEGLVINGYA